MKYNRTVGPALNSKHSIHSYINISYFVGGSVCTSNKRNIFVNNCKELKVSKAGKPCVRLKPISIVSEHYFGMVISANMSSMFFIGM